MTILSTARRGMMRAAVMGARPAACPAVFQAAMGGQARWASQTRKALARFSHDVQKASNDASSPAERTTSEYDALTPQARKYLGRVYATTASAIMSVGAGSALMMMTPLGATVPIYAPMIGMFVPLIGLNWIENPKARVAAMQSFSLMLGMSIAPVVAVAKAGQVLVPAIGLTSATFAGFSAAALLAPAGSSARMQGPLMAGLFGLIGIQLFSFFYPTPVMHQVMMYGGLALFSLMISSDTGAMIERANAGAHDVVSDSINMLMNLVNVFVRIVSILRGDNE